MTLHDNRWWRKSSEEWECENCGKTKICMVWKAKGKPKSGYRLLCPSCYKKLIYNRSPEKSLVSKVPLYLSILLVTLVLSYSIYCELKLNLHKPQSGLVSSSSIISSMLVTNVPLDTKKERLVEWAYSVSSNVPREILQQEIETAISESKNLALAVVVIALIRNESSFDPGCISKAGARGPMQVMPSHERGLINLGIIKELKDLHHPVYGVKAGVSIFRTYLSDNKGNTRLALQTYLGATLKTIDSKMTYEAYFNRVVNTIGELLLVLDTGEDVHNEGV